MSILTRPIGAIPHDSEGRMVEQCGKFIRGELSQDETDALRRDLSSQVWFGLLQDKMRIEVAKSGQARAAEKAKFISECLSPLGENDGTQEMAMRQLRLLAAILERTP